MLDPPHALDSARRLRFFRRLLAAGLVVSVGLLMVRGSEYLVAPRSLSLLYLSSDVAGTLVLLGLFYLVWKLDHTLVQQWDDTRRLQVRYRAIVDTQQEMIWRCALEGTVTFVNTALCRAFERTEAELLQHAVAALLPPDLEVHSYLARLLQTPDSPQDTLKKRSRTPDRVSHRENLFSPPGGGPARWHQWRDRVLLDERGQPMEIQSTGYDITQRKAYEASLAQSESRFAEVEQLARVGSYEIILPDGPVCWSQGVYAIVQSREDIARDRNLGYDDIRAALSDYSTHIAEGELPLDKLVQLIHPDDQARVKVAIVGAVASGQQFDLVLRMGTGQAVKHLRLVGHVRPSQYGANRGGASITGLAVDVTNFVEAEAGLRHYAEELQSLSRRLVEVQEDERRRIARELHDEVGQQLTGLRLMLEMAEHASDTAIRYRLTEMVQTATTVTNQVRELSASLRPTMLDDLGLQPALCWLLERYTGHTGIKVDLRCSGLDGQRFATPVETVAYRITQEALTNVARYAGVTTAHVSVWATRDALQVQVSDSGAGFDPVEAMGRGRTSGLSGMRERALSVGGELVIESTPGRGTRVSARLPLG